MQWITNFIVACVLGFLAGIGTGGGSLLMLWLTMVRGMDPETVKTYNLLFFIPGALIATLLRRKAQEGKCTGLLPAIVTGCAAAAAISALADHIQPQLLKRLFGLLLIAAGIREVLFKPKKE